MKYYRFILPGESLQREGDELFDQFENRWVIVHRRYNGHVLQMSEYGHYRRQVTEDYLIKVIP